MKYTTPHSLPIIEPAIDKIKDSASVSALAEAVNRLSTAANTAVTVEGERVEQVADDKFGGLPGRMDDTEARTEQIVASPGYRVTDQDRRVALEINDAGETVIGGTKHRAAPGWRVCDTNGRVALEVDGAGRTHIHDMAGGQSSVQVSTLHIFLASGQSNMQGRGFPIKGPQSPRIMQFGANRRVIEQAPLQLDMVPGTAAGTSPALFFANNYLATQPAHVGVLLIPAAYGGTKFTWDATTDGLTWTNGAATNPDNALYERSVQQALDAIATAKAEGYQTVLKGVLWHQGEGNGGVATETYANALDKLIADYRADLDHPTLPVMIGQQCPEGMEANTAKYTVDAAHQDTPYRTAFTGFAPAARGAHNDGDTTHFSTVGTSYLGDTYNTAYIQALGNTKP